VTSAGRDPVVDWTTEPHHDPSAPYVEPGSRTLGDRIPVRVRVPRGHGEPTAVVVRAVVDGEPTMSELREDRRTSTDTWFAGEVRLVNPVTPYRFGIETPASTTWLNSAGTHPHDVTDAADFRLTTHAPPPAWLAGSVGYQIFPDRFARSAGAPPMDEVAPGWAIPARWQDPVLRTPGQAVRQLFGGDLRGVEEHLDHLDSLGVDLLYLTPFFPGHSAHRYDASTFDHVDPLLGGDAALASLTAAAHRRGIRVIGDLTLNHSGSHHDWFERAQADASSPEAGFYMFRSHPTEYVAWYDVPSLPKLDHRDAELRRRLVDGPGSVVARWLGPPWSLDGWRIDCANVTARHGETDLNALVARTTRATMAAADGDDRWLVAEHCYDATTDLDGAGWHGVMAYQWFTRPLAQWLGTARPLRMMSLRPLTPLDASGAASAMRTLAAGVPWSAITASMTMLDSHDTARFRTLVGGDRDVHAVAMAALMTFPGVPTLFAGSEIGVEGDSQDTGRVPFPWDGAWDHEFLDTTHRLIALRRGSDALQRGGLRWLRAGEGSITYLRESPAERVLVHLATTDAPEVRLDLAALGASDADVLHGTARRDPFTLPPGPSAVIARLHP
jgi:alpha-glucosidase